MLSLLFHAETFDKELPSSATVLRMSTRMRLRTRIKAPERFEDEDYDTPAASNGTKPAFPRLLKEQTIFFDPHLPPAAFPSLKQTNPQLEDDDRMSHDVAEPVHVDMMDIDRSSDRTGLPIVHREA